MRLSKEDPVPCEDWISVKVDAGIAYVTILSHVGQENLPYLIGYDCQPNPPCSGGEYMIWPDGPNASNFEFHSPNGGTYNLIVAQMGHRACATVTIPANR